MQYVCVPMQIYDLYTCFQAPPQEKENHTFVVTSFGLWESSPHVAFLHSFSPCRTVKSSCCKENASA